MQNQSTDIETEMALLKERMFSMLHIWAMLEDSLSVLLQNTIMPTNVNQKKFGFAAYFATDSAWTRFQVVSAVMEECLDGEPHEKEALEAWGELERRLDSAKKARNKIAHGTISAPVIHGKQSARITGPMFKIKRYQGRAHAEGMSLRDIEDGINKCGRCMMGIQAFSELVMSTKLKNHDDATLKRICLELREHLKSGADQIFAPTPTILPAPPQSS